MIPIGKTRVNQGYIRTLPIKCTAFCPFPLTTICLLARTVTVTPVTSHHGKQPLWLVCRCRLARKSPPLCALYIHWLESCCLCAVLVSVCLCVCVSVCLCSVQDSVCVCVCAVCLACAVDMWPFRLVCTHRLAGMCPASWLVCWSLPFLLIVLAQKTRS
jgi:hypothetical protein